MTVEAVCFIPCCSKKYAGSGVENPPDDWPGRELARTRPMLETGRRGMDYCIEKESRPTPALSLYKGGFYADLNLELIRRLVKTGKLRLFIISAGYGVLDAFEPARKYEAGMEGRVARHWRDAGLADVIGEICLDLDPGTICGFFAGTSFWSGTGANYRYFFTEGVRKALRSGLKPARAGCFYRESGMGVTAILGALGRCFGRYLTGGPQQEEMVQIAKSAGLKDGGIVIGYEELAKPSRPIPCETLNGEKIAPVLRAGVPPSTEDFKLTLDAFLKKATGSFVDVRAGELHKLVGGYHGNNHRMPACCQVMRNAMLPGDKVVDEPPSGKGARLTVRYLLPR